MKRSVTWAALAVALVLSATGCAATAEPVAVAPVGAVASSIPKPTRIHLPPHARAFFFGDSWTAGKSATPGNGYARVVGRALGWTVTVAPNGSGTGYVHTYNPERGLYPQRAAKLPAIDADIIVLQGGLNDRPGPLTHFSDAVRQTVKTLRQKSGGTPIVMLGPSTFTGSSSTALATIDAGEAAVAKQLIVPYISPLKQHWINPSNVSMVIDPTTQHPSTRSHTYFGGRVAQALESLTVVDTTMTAK